MPRNIATSNRTYDLFGILGSPRNRPGCHTKKNSIGPTTATFPNRKAGMTVNAGKGLRIVGTFETRSPIDAGTSNPKPAMSVATPLFENGLSSFTVAEYYIRTQCVSVPGKRTNQKSGISPQKDLSSYDDLPGVSGISDAGDTT